MHDNFISDIEINYEKKRKESSGNTLKNQRREYRKINHFKGVEEIPNDNMYKNNYYTINSRVEFDDKAEENFRLFFHFCYSKEGIKIILSILYTRLLFSRINIFKDLFKLSNIIYLGNFFHILSFIASIYITSEKYLKNQVINLLIFILFAINHCLYILVILYKTNTNRFHFISIPSELIFNYSLAFFLDIPHKLVLSSFGFVSIIIFIGEKKLIGFTLFYLILGIIFALSLYFLYNIIIREIWALFDSFKRSYYNIKQCVLEKNLNPNFIVSLKIVTYERNQSAINFGNLISGNKNNKVELLNIIHPKLKELFIKLIGETFADVDNRDSFYFPFCKLDNKENNFDEPNINGMFSFDYLKFRWYLVLVSKTVWKFKPAISICLYPDENIISNEIFSNYSEKFINLLEQLINNNDIICSEITRTNIEKIKGCPLTFRNRAKKPILAKKKLSYFSGSNASNILKNLPKKSCYEINKSNKKLFKTMLFFCKSQIELLYDISLTIEFYFYKITKDTFFHYGLKKGLREESETLDLNIIKNYYFDFFCDIFKEKNCTIDYNIKNKNSNKIIIEANFLRILMFNATFFMEKCLNKNNSIKQGLQIAIKVLKKCKEKVRHQSSHNLKEDIIQNENNIEGNLEFSFTLFSGDANIDLGKISKLFTKKKEAEIYSLKNELIQAKYLGIGLLTVYHLLNDFYKTTLILSTRKNDDGSVDHSLKFKISCKLEEDGLICKSVTPKSDNFHFIPSCKQLETPFLKPKNYFNQNSYYNENFKKLYNTANLLFNNNDDIKNKKFPESPLIKTKKRKSLEIPKNLINNRFSFKDFIPGFNRDGNISISSQKSDSSETSNNEKIKIKVLIINGSPESIELSQNLL